MKVEYVGRPIETNLGPRILKETAEVISEPLTNIFNRSLETGIVPDDWKRANVTPIFKKGNKQIPNNYRPISLTSVISKTIERLLKVRITKHLNDQNLINDTQHGFREKRSCLTNLFDFFGEVNRLKQHFDWGHGVEGSRTARSRCCSVPVLHGPSASRSRCCTARVLHSPGAARPGCFTVPVLHGPGAGRSRCCTARVLHGPGAARSLC
ncbi:Reverse transcriptase domain [Trinorchestia longiramus]|nr:Reverse transcriptase domain [Trinorchestia longiramus]